MALKLSTALRNAILSGRAFKHAMSNCVLKVYTGAQPSTADAAPTGTLLCTYSSSAGALTREVLSVGSLTLAGTSGTADTFTLNGIEIMGGVVTSDGTVAGTATLVAKKINDNPKNVYVKATTTGASGVITLTAKQGLGSLPNGWVPAGTGTTITFGTPVNMAGGVTALNGLLWGDVLTGVLSKLAAQTWSGIAGATGTAGWCRFEAAVVDAGALDSLEAVLRMDGAVATSGAELNLSSLSIVNTVLQTIDTFTVTLPTS
jgi:hypothetical protein